jgi:transposase-like protein
MINKEFTSILDLLKSFPDEQTCISHLEELRWNGNVISPFDSTSRVYKCKGNKYRCKNTGKYFNVRTATLFDNTKIELKKWFLAIYIITSHKKGISSLQLSRDIDVTQKTAWFMLQRIRNCFGINDNELLNNEVEIDETYIGGKESNRHRKNKKATGTGMVDKTPVFGMLERDKLVKAEVVERNPNAKTLKPIIRKKISKSATIITDGFGAYTNLNREYNHIIVNHIQGEYTKGVYHTNTIEGFWSLLKRGIFGIYHFTSDKHLQKYVDEFTFRYNSIDLTTAKRFDLMLANSEHRLTYKELIK